MKGFCSMDATSIILLIGLVSFWGAIGVAIGFLVRFRKTLDTLESTLGQVQTDLAELTPVITETLGEVEKTGQEVGQTAAEVRILARRANSGSAPVVIGGAVSYLPLAIGAFKMIQPLFNRKKRSK